MAKFTFKGGIHPFDGKEMSKNKEMVAFPASKEMVFPHPYFLLTSICTATGHFAWVVFKVSQAICCQSVPETQPLDKL